MRYLFVICLFTTAACGLPNPPVTGIYDVTSTVTDMIASPSNTTCTSNTPEVSNMVVELSKSGNVWELYFCDNTCTQKMLLGTSNDGHSFNPQGCSGPWCFNITFDLSYETKGNKTTLSGESRTILTMPGYASGSCTEVSAIEGTKR